MVDVRVGVFGKIESYAEYIRAGLSSTTAQFFERWLQMANDQVAAAKAELPSGPVGFCFRDDQGSALLVGVLVGSRDKVGRRFPLALFAELQLTPGLATAGLPDALRPLLTELSELASTASRTDPAGLKKALFEVELPDTSAFTRDASTHIDALEEITLNRLVERLYPDKKNTAYGFNVLLRACDRAIRDGVRRGVTLDVGVTSDVELSLWLACAEIRLAGRVGPVSAFWDVAQQRALIVPGVPDANTLVFLSSQTAQHARLWRASTSSASARDTARAELGPELCSMLDDGSQCSVLHFIRALAPTTN